jgi:hypothetical protein
MKVLVLLTVALAGCDYAATHNAPRAKEAVDRVFPRCREICPAGTRAMVVASYDADIMSDRWSCGCLDANVLSDRPVPPEKAQ